MASASRIAETMLRKVIRKVDAPSAPELSQKTSEHAEAVIEVEVNGVHYSLVRSPLRHAQRLSPRELEIVRLVAKGLPNKCIASVLEISEWTVATHIRRIFAKLGVNSRAAMIAHILENGTLRNRDGS